MGGSGSGDDRTIFRLWLQKMFFGVGWQIFWGHGVAKLFLTGVSKMLFNSGVPK